MWKKFFQGYEQVNRYKKQGEEEKKHFLIENDLKKYTLIYYWTDTWQRGIYLLIISWILVFDCGLFLIPAVSHWTSLHTDSPTFILVFNTQEKWDICALARLQGTVRSLQNILKLVLSVAWVGLFSLLS